MQLHAQIQQLLPALGLAIVDMTARLFLEDLGEARAGVLSSAAGSLVGKGWRVIGRQRLGLMALAAWLRRVALAARLGLGLRGGA